MTVSRVARTFVSAEETNRLDNEAADINGAGVQLYLARGGTTAAAARGVAMASPSGRSAPRGSWFRTLCAIRGS